jgi:hypothetical protein
MEFPVELTPKDKDDVYYYFVDLFGDYLVKEHEKLCSDKSTNESIINWEAWKKVNGEKNKIIITESQFYRLLEQTSDEISGSDIRLALKKAFPNNWVPRNKEFSAGLRGIYTIGERLGKPEETWSIMNYFDTKPEIHDLLFLKYMEDGEDRDIIDWMVDLFKNDHNFTQLLVDRQWQSIESGLKLERDSVNSFFEVVNPSSIKYYPHGSIMDRYNGVDVTVDGSNYQIKPLVSYKRGDGMNYIITTYGMRDYQNKSKVDFIAYANEKEVLIFENSDYSVLSKSKVLHRKSPKMEVINNETVN